MASQLIEFGTEAHLETATQSVRSLLLFAVILAFATTPIYAQAGGGSPWENAVNVLQTSFTGPIAKGLALVSIVVGGLMTH